MISRYSIRSLLLLLVLAFTVPAFALLGHALYKNARQSLVETEVAARALSVAGASDLDRLIMANRDFLERMAQRPSVRALDERRCDPVLVDLRQLFPLFANLFTVDRTGRILCSVVPRPGGKEVSAAKADWFRQAMTEKRFLAGKPLVGQITGKWVSVLTYPILDGQGELLGLVGLPLDLTSYKPRLSDVPLPPGTTIDVVRPDGVVVWRNVESEKWIGKRIAGIDGARPAPDSGNERSESVGLDGVRRIYATKAVRGVDWFVLVGIPSRPAYERARQEAGADLLLFLGGLTIVVGFAFAIARRIERPVRELADAARTVRDGDLQVRVAASGPSEIKDVAAKFNEMLEARGKIENALRANEAKLRGLFELSPLGIALVDMAGRHIEFNEAFRAISGYSAEELKALDHKTLTPDKYEAEEARQLQSLLQRGRCGPYEKEYVRKDGSLVAVRFNGNLIAGDDGGKYIWAIVEDVTDRKQTEANLSIAATAFEAQAGIMVTDAAGVILRVNQAFVEGTGYTAEEIVGQTPRLLKSGRHDADYYAAMWDSLHTSGAWQGEIWDRRKNGEIYPKWLTITAVKDEDGVTTHYVSTQIDITERKAAEEEIRSLAFYDPLTHLPNRRLLLDRLHQALAASARSRKHGALLFIDLDNFKTLNDTLGHDKGDLLLQQVARRLTTCVREGDTVARLGGDEFVVMLEDLSRQPDEAATHAETVGEKILAALVRSYLLNGQEYRSTASIGITLFGNRDEGMEELLMQADLAMYQAKAAGRNALRFFDPKMQAAVANRAAMEKDLHHAIKEGEFVLYYQAQIETGDHVIGAEALLRWQHPERGLTFPGDFIPLAEETGAIVPLGRWVLETACAQLAQWAKRPETAHLALAVNVSVRQLRQPDFVAQVQATLDRTGADPRKLTLELTESVLLDEVEDTIAKMTALKACGVGFALDDFGTGYSSLAYLKRLPLEKLKIDRSFVIDLLTDPNDAAIARTIVALARSLGLAVIAEGVETEAQRDFLALNGCHAYQGYLFSRPLPVDGFERLLRK